MQKEVRTVCYDDDLQCYLHSLHRMIMDGSKEFEKEEMLQLLISLLIRCLVLLRQAYIFIQKYLYQHAYA